MRTNTITKISAKWLIVASLLCVLFGNGVHIHSLLDHIFDHGDIHVFVHAHDHQHNSDHEDHDKSDPETEQHDVAKVDLNGVLSQSRIQLTADDFVSQFVAVIPEMEQLDNSETIEELNLPPPDVSYSDFLPLSNSLRGPPLV